MTATRPATEQDLADAHDTKNFVLAYHLKVYNGGYPLIILTEVQPSPYIPMADGHGWAHWTTPTKRAYIFRPQGANGENRFAFEIPISTKNITLQEVARQLHMTSLSLAAVGANEVHINRDRNVVTGTFLYLSDHPTVCQVRAFGTYPFVDGNGNHVPAQTTPYGRNSR